MTQAEIFDQIMDAYKTAKNYPALAAALIEIGIESYTVDVATGTMLYRMGFGNNLMHPSHDGVRAIAEHFDEAKVIRAIRDNQQGKTTYPQFMDGIAAAGVRFYEATLHGENKRVTYIGSVGFYEESIPI